MSDYDRKIKIFIEDQIQNLQNIKIIEFGVERGRSTKMFLDLCKKNNGKLFSIDVEDCSNLFDDPNWKFFNCRDDNFELLDDKLPKNVDIIYLDTLHEADHVEKIFYHYYDFLRIGGQFYIDDISWLPYLHNKDRNSFYCEINNKETFKKLLEIYNNNQSNFDMEFSFVSSGMCRIIKKKNELQKPLKFKTRENSLKNLIRKILRK